ncbi:hypothetical protein AB0O42_05915 [Streptomyces sp. NPDC089922]|uniref:hypothetical protein n=1 Tax=Streptomyces sp. NPDC089922 TaxID=3155189 RepID=UPI00342B0593
MKPVRCLRALRAATFAALCVVLAAVGHVLMSGAAVPWWALAAGFAGSTAAAWCLAGRERGTVAVTAAAVAVQTLLHSGFSLAQSAAPRLLAGSAGTPAGTGHAHHGAHGGAGHGSASALADGGHDMADMSTALLPPALMSPAGMTAAHLLAAVLCGLWLAHGERAAFRLVRAVAARLWTPLGLLLRSPAVVGHPPRPRVRRRRRERAPRQLFLVHAITSRGPPAGSAVL